MERRQPFEKGTGLQGKRALVIGIGEYENRLRLSNPENDAKDMKSALKNIGFDVTKGVHLTYDEMKHAIDVFKNSIKPGDIVLFYFSGHGAHRNDQNYLIPKDAAIPPRPDFDTVAISAQAILDQLSNRKPRFIIFLLDCCRKYDLLSSRIGARDRSERSSKSQGLIEMKKKDSLVAFAYAPETIASDEEGQRNGLFTKHLLEHIKNTNDDIFTMLSNVIEGVKEESAGEQITFLSSSRTEKKIYLNKETQDMPSEQKDLFYIREQDLEWGQEIGRGTFGIVWRARWLPKKEIVAVKRLYLTNLKKNQESSFFKEVSRIHGIDYEHIITLYGLCVDHGMCNLVMEYMPLGSLYKILHEDRTQLNWSDRLSIALQAGKGINYLHDLDPPIIHCNIKSSNFLLTTSDDKYIVKVCDFGLDQVRYETERQTAMTDVIPWTLQWTAPEILRKGEHTTKSDVYSLGMVYWELASKKIPYDGYENDGILNSVINGKLPKIPEATPPDFAKLIEYSLLFDPKDRPACSKVIKIIERCIDSEGSLARGKRSERLGHEEGRDDEEEEKKMVSSSPPKSKSTTNSSPQPTSPVPKQSPVNKDTTAKKILAERYFDVDMKLNTGTRLETIEQSPLSSLKSSVETLNRWIKDIKDMENFARKQKVDPKYRLTVDEAAAICIYTMQGETFDQSIPFQLNKILRAHDNSARLKPWIAYIQLLLSGLKKLPLQKGTIWQFSEKKILHEKDSDIVWYGFSSCTADPSILEHTTDYMAASTILKIKCKNGISIRDFSSNPDEDEVLLLPGTVLKVIGKEELKDGKTLLLLEEQIGEDLYAAQQRLSKAPISETNEVEQPSPKSEKKKLNPTEPTPTSERSDGRGSTAEKRWLNLDFQAKSGKSFMSPDSRQDYMDNPPTDVDETILNRVKGSMIGMALGDALGAHVEFRPREYLLQHPVRDLEGGGTWGLSKGQFTDDTSMALCLANSLVSRKDFVPYDQLVRYKWWYRDGYMSSTGKCFDIGAATSDSLNEFERRQKNFSKENGISKDKIDSLADSNLLKKFDTMCSSDGVAGNGALMRLAPVPLFFYKHPTVAVRYSGVSGVITHGDRKAYDACRYYGALIVAALHGESKEEILSKDFYDKHRPWFGGEELVKEVMVIANGSYQRKGGYDQGIRGKGYIINALEAALWAFWSDENSFKNGALNAVNLGDDTDTTAAIYGQLAGAYYGYDRLPKEWTKHVYARPFIECLSKWIVYEGDQWQPTSDDVDVKKPNKQIEKPTSPVPKETNASVDALKTKPKDQVAGNTSNKSSITTVRTRPAPTNSNVAVTRARYDVRGQTRSTNDLNDSTERFSYNYSGTSSSTATTRIQVQQNYNNSRTPTQNSGAGRNAHSAKNSKK